MVAQAPTLNCPLEILPSKEVVYPAPVGGLGRVTGLPRDSATVGLSGSRFLPTERPRLAPRSDSVPALA